MTGELKLCPMCEGTADYVGREGQGYWVECKQCLTRGPWGDYGYQAKDGWNKRALVRMAPRPTDRRQARLAPVGQSGSAWNSASRALRHILVGIFRGR